MADFDLSMAITAEGDAAANEVKKVTGAVRGLNEAEGENEVQSRRTGQSAAELARQQKATADAINAVTRATNPAIGSQRALESALRRAENAYVAGKISAGAYGRAQEIANRAAFASVAANKSASAGMRGVGLQLNDIGTQMALGQNAGMAFAANIGQVGFAMSQMQGKAQLVGNFLAGPWGAAIAIAGALLGGLIGKFLSADDAAKGLTEAARIQTMSLEELSDAIADSNKELEKSIQTGRQAEQQTLNEAEARRRHALEIRRETQALLEQAVARESEAKATPGRAGLELQAGAAAVRSSLQTRLDEANRALQAAEQNVRLAQVPLLRRDSAARTDPQKAIQEDYEARVQSLNGLFSLGIIKLGSFNAGMDEANKKRDAETKALQESNRTPRQISLGDQLDSELGQRLLAAAQSKTGLREGSAGLGDFFKASGVKIDPEKEAWCAAFVNAVLAGQGISGTGKLNARSFLGFGQGTDSPEKGDIVVLKRGADQSKGHVGFFAGQDANGRILVTAGNQGNAVSTAPFDRSQVLGFRRAPSASDAFAAEERQRDALAKFGSQAQGTLSGFAGRADSNDATSQALAQIKQIDALLDEIAEKKPPNWEELIDQGQIVRDIIRDGINKPFDDFIAAQKEAAELEKLRAEGRQGEADALQNIYRLQEQMGRSLLPEEVAQVKAITAQRALQAEQAAKAQAAQRKYLDELAQYKDAFRSLFDKGGVQAFPGKIFGILKQQAGDNLFDQLFGNIFKQLEEKATGADKVRAGNIKLAAQAERTAKAINSLGNAAAQASGQVSGTETPEIGADVAQGITESPLGGILGKLGKGIGLSDGTIASIGSKVGQAAGGAATGAMVNNFLKPLGKALGFKTSATGAAIGGAIGSFIPIPGGDIIGSIIGSIVGGLFKKSKTKAGSSTITNVFDEGSLSGNSGKFKEAAGQLASSVQGGLQSIAEALGGGLGAFAVSIGVRHGDFRVDTSGTGQTQNSDPTVKDFNDDQAGAIMYAIMDAISDGAITGLSAAVTAALKSSPDLDKALREALKVQELEYLIGGVFAQLEKPFRQFEQVAAERVRLAKKYGLDLLKVEKINAEERAALLKEVLESRIGDLQNFLKDMKFGSLFEGTPMEQRQALLGEIATTRTRADAGEEGAASELAALERQLLELSRNTFGTAGPEYAADRAAAQADAERIIAEETQRVQEAQERAIAQLSAANQSVALQNETNNLLAQSNYYLSVMAGTPSGVSGGGVYSGTVPRSTIMRTVYQ